MSPRSPARRPTAVAALLLILTAPITLAAAGASVAPHGFAPERTRTSNSAYEHLAATVRDGLEATETFDADAWDALEAAWRRSPDLAERLDTLAALQTRLVVPAPSLARARLGAFAGDLQGHRALAAAGEAAHDAVVRALVERIRASGDGSAERPWQVHGSGEAVAFLRELGAEPLGGYYGTPAARRLTLVVHARAAGETWARQHHFDLGATLDAWREATTYSSTAWTRHDARDLISSWSEQLDHFALTSIGLLTAAERGESGHYAAAQALTRAADAGNGVARYSLGDLFLNLAEDRPALAERARASARAHHRRAAEAGLPHAHYKLGLLAEQDGDPALAARHLGAALEGGETAALWPLLKQLLPTDPARAEVLLRDAARGGDARAAYQLGILRFDVAGETDPEAAELLEQAAEAGYVDAQLYLGDLLATGRQLTQDQPRARSLWSAVVRDSDDVDAVLAAGRALTRNPGTELHDPGAVVAGVERLLRTPRIARGCADCWLLLVEALEVDGADAAARRALAEGRRTLLDASALTPPAAAIAAAPGS